MSQTLCRSKTLEKRYNPKFEVNMMVSPRQKKRPIFNNVYIRQSTNKYQPFRDTQYATISLMIDNGATGKSSSQKQLEEQSMQLWQDTPRLRFVITAAIYGASIGIFTIIVNFLVQSDDKYPYLVQHMPLGRTIIFSGSGAAGGLLISALAAFWLHGGGLSLFPDRKRKRLNFRNWVLLGVGYGLIFTVIMGGLILPLTFNMLNFSDGIMNPMELIHTNVDAVLRGPVFAIVLGVRLLFTAVIAGIMFGVGAWLIDIFHSSSNHIAVSYGTWVIALALASAVIGIATIGPEQVLTHLG